MFQSVQPICALSKAILFVKNCSGWLQLSSRSYTDMQRHHVPGRYGDNTPLDRSMSDPVLRQRKVLDSNGSVLTPCEWTIPFGVPVVPDENITTNGVWKGTWVNVNFLPVPRARKSSKDVLDSISKGNITSNVVCSVTDAGDSKFSRGPTMIKSVFPCCFRALIETPSVLEMSCLLPL